MIYRHKRTGDLYLQTGMSFSVEDQSQKIEYISLKTGEKFNRLAEKFKENFEYVSDPQPHIIPKDPHK